MIVFQVAMALFALFMMYVLRIHFRKQHIGAVEFGMWGAVWSGFVLFSLFPSSLRGVADALHIGRIFDLLVIAAMIIITTVTISTRLSMAEIRQKMEQLVREEALQQARGPVRNPRNSRAE